MENNYTSEFTELDAFINSPEGQVFIIYYNKNRDFNKEISSIEDLVYNLYSSSGDREETSDYNYIYHTYQSQINGYLFEVYGSQYRKDQCICEEEFEDRVIVINIELERESKEHKTHIKKEIYALKWKELFKNKTKQEIYEIIKYTKFPKIDNDGKI